MEDSQPEVAGAGRPTLYTKSYCQKIIEYFSVPPYVKEGTRLEPSDLPNMAGFAVSIGVSRFTLMNWAEEFPDFKEAYEIAKSYQENFLLVNGHRGLIDSRLTAFTLKNAHGYREKQPDEHDVIVNNLTEKSDDEIKARIQELMEKHEPSK